MIDRNLSPYQEFAEAVRDIILVLDLEGKIIKANEAACSVYGYSRAELLRMTIFDLRAPEAANQVYSQLNKAKNEGVIFETKHITKDRRIIPVEVSSRRAIIGNKAVLLSTIRDISDRYTRDAELLKLFTAVEQSPVSVVITDPHGAIEYVNPKFTEVTGYTAGEALGQNPRILKSGAQPPEVYTELWQTIKAGREWRGEFHNRKKNGGMYWELASISPIRNAAGNITHFIAVKEDITARKEVEAALRRAQEALVRDLRLAGKVQKDFLPRNLELDKLQVETVFEPYHHVSGDVYDYIWDSRRGIFAGYVLDVMGHGIGTALQTAALRVLFRQAMERDLSPRAKLSWINREALPYFAEDTFAAAIYFEFDFKRNVLKYSAAGINYFIAATDHTGGVVCIPGLFLGITETADYEEHEMAFHPGSSFYFMSDGLFDMLEDHNPIPAMGYSEAREFLQMLSRSAQRHDDATALCIQTR